MEGRSARDESARLEATRQTIEIYTTSGEKAAFPKSTILEIDMNHENLSSHSHESSMSQLVEKAGRHWEVRRHAAVQPDVTARTPHPFAIALSREAGTQGTAVAHEVGRLHGWHVYDDDLLERGRSGHGCTNEVTE
jgi:hypothetical protein